MTAATDAIGFYVIIGSLYGLQVPSRDCHVGRWPPRNDNSGAFTILTTARTDRYYTAGHGCPLPYIKGLPELFGSGSVFIVIGFHTADAGRRCPPSHTRPHNPCPCMRAWGNRPYSARRCRRRRRLLCSFNVCSSCCIYSIAFIILLKCANVVLMC